MPTIDTFQHTIEQSLMHLQECLAYESKKINNQEVQLHFDNSVVKYLLDPHYYDLSVSIHMDKDIYDVLLLMELLSPEYLDQMQQYKELKEEERLHKYINVYGTFIGNHCESLLQGSVDQKADYDAFYEEARKLQAAVLQLSFSDPIRKKFFSGDRTWKQDLKKKMNW